jgi:hypothetical protein
MGAWIGSAYASGGFIQRSEAILKDLTPSVDSKNKKHMGYFHLRLGEIATAKGAGIRRHGRPLSFVARGRGRGRAERSSRFVRPS